MKVSLNWLKQYVDVKLPAAEVANRLTLGGIEVKSTNVIGANWEGIIVGQILEVQQHPNADRLHLVTLDLAHENRNRGLRRAQCGGRGENRLRANRHEDD